MQGREDLSPSADGNARIIDPTRSTEIAVFTNTPSVSRLRPKHRQPRAFLAEAPLLCASAKNRCGLRVDRLFPPSPFRFLHATFAALRWHGAPFRLHSQTIFTPTFPLYPRHLRLRLRCRVRSHSGVSRNLRLLFRAVDAMPPLSILRSARADNLRAPPTHRGSCHCHSVRWLPFIIRDERIEVIACGTFFICRRGQNVCGFHYRPHPERGFCNGFLPLNTSVARIPSHRQLRAFLAEVPLPSTSAKNCCVLRVERLRPPACPPLFPDTAPASRCRARMSAPAVINSL